MFFLVVGLSHLDCLSWNAPSWNSPVRSPPSWDSPEWLLHRRTLSLGRSGSFLLDRRTLWNDLMQRTTHQNRFLHFGTLRQGILNHDTLGNGLSFMVFSLVRLSNMAVSIA